VGDPHRLGANAPHALIREVACVSGAVEVDIHFEPRPEYGLVTPILTEAGGVIAARGGPAFLYLYGPSGMRPDLGAGTATGRYPMTAGQTIRFALQWVPLGESTMDSSTVDAWDADRIGDELRTTIDAWQGWSAAHRTYDGPWRELVHHSGRVLHALTYQPTGAIVAAVTTSLPEAVGGDRNWDYRYTWIRDATLTMDALWVAACPDEAHKFFAFLTTAAATPRPDGQLQIMYGIGGEHDLTEHVLDHLPGWQGCQPVRIGNDAWTQSQLDVYGELLATAARYADQLPDDPPLRAFLIRLADTAAALWREPDHGIWEIRGRRQHFLHSKLMCWVALDRGVDLADRLGATDRAPNWAAARDEIRAAIETDGFNEGLGAYTQTLRGSTLDAATLMIPIVGFADGNDPRVRSTVDAIERGLTDDHGLVYRYDNDTGVDGLAGGEGTFLICTFWLARAQALAGRVDAARETFARATGYANDLGLLAEQVDPTTGMMLGNFPQAFSHIGLINTANTIAEAQRARPGRWPPWRGVTNVANRLRGRV
jgi:GH15 family glucan-1,4-alpha-glucosidase